MNVAENTRRYEDFTLATAAMDTDPLAWTWVDPTATPGWDDLTLRHPDASVFHTSGWARVLRDAYGYRLHYAVQGEDEDSALLPVAEVDSLLTGRRGVCLPCSDACAPLVGDDGDASPLLETMLTHGRARRWRYMELRGGTTAPPPFVPSARYVEHRLALERDEAAQRSKLRGAHRRCLDKAAAADGVVVEASTALDALERYYALHCRTRRRHGVPPQPRRFFRSVHEHLLARGWGRIVLACVRGEAVAGALFLHAGREATYKFAASDPEHWAASPNHLVLWEAIRHYGEAGFAILSFGRSDPGARGLTHFKRGWGARERPLAYHRAWLRGAAPVASRAADADGRATSGAGGEAARAVVRRLPLPVLRLCGRLMYRHVG